MKHPGHAALVLAAGESSRMGRPKPLLDIGGITVLERVIRLFRDAGIDDVRVVTGHRPEQLSPLLESLGIQKIHNPGYREGMFSSVVAGVQSLAGTVDGFFVLPVDVPLVRPRTVMALLDAHSENKDRILYPCFHGKRGHPPLIPGSLAGELLKWSGEGGLRAFLALYQERAVDLAVADGNILLDMDTPEDYEQILKRFERYDIPTERECLALMVDVHHLEDRLMDHCRGVARAAKYLATELREAGLAVDPELANAAGLLHDIAKGQPDHAGAGARILEDLGFPRVAEVVAAHVDLDLPAGRPLDEREIVCFADKLMEGGRLVSVQARFGGKLERYGDIPEVRRKIEGRMERALRLGNEIGRILGRDMDALLRGIETGH